MKQKQSRIRRIILARFTLFAVITILAAGCVSHVQYRTTLESCKTFGTTNACETAALEETSDYLLGFVEFDDQGWLWSRAQMHAVLDRFAEEDAKQGLVMLVFVHGWKHNASFNDSNVQMFRKNLAIMSRMERAAGRKEGRHARKVVGVYVGWRGLSQDIWGLNNVTFWTRKNTAHEVGRGALSELFLRLEDLRNSSRIIHGTDRKPTQLIIVGHSFGGAATYSALAPLLVERMVQTVDTKGDVHQPRGFGDLVVLVNPAFEAARYAVLENIAEEMKNGFFTNQPVNLAIFTSKTDDATKIAFPIGRAVSTAFEKNRSAFERSANRTAVGHFTPFITHDLTAKPKAAMSEDQEVEASSDKINSLKTQMKEAQQAGAAKGLSFSGSELTPRDPHHNPFFPLYVVSVDKKIIPDHGSIDEKEFLTFLREFLLWSTSDQNL